MSVKKFKEDNFQDEGDFIAFAHALDSMKDLEIFLAKNNITDEKTILLIKGEVKRVGGLKGIFTFLGFVQ